MTREESNELIDMLTIIKGQAIKSNNDTAIINIKIDSLNFVIDKAIKAIEQEPKTGRWIPVTERLPEDVNDVLCWYIYSENDKLYQTYGIGFYWNEIWGGEKWHGERCKVIAWMPLPEPYKKEGEGE